MSDFDPNLAADPDAGLFGLDTTLADAELVVLPVPFDATCSFRRGAANGPAAVLEASHQVELFDPVVGEPWQRGIHMLEADPRFAKWNAEARGLANRIVERGGRLAGNAQLEADLARVNTLSGEVDQLVADLVGTQLDANKRCVLLGGDHSTALGSLRATAARHPGLGVLHIDAHADLRVAFEGFERSHASVLHNAFAEALAPELGPASNIAALVQVGLRDLCPAEMARIESDARLTAVFDHSWSEVRARGGDLGRLIEQAIETLPAEVYLTLDIDGLDPSLCPNTGTPVPGGLVWHEAWMWIDAIRRSGRRLVGADLVEVAPNQAGDSLDAVVAARLLLRMLGALD